MSRHRAQETSPMSRHAESRTMEASRRMTAFLETAPVLALTGISFGGSCGNVFRFFGACGITGIFQYGDTACPDLLCFVAAREILRDRRVGRTRKFGYITWPMVVLIIGITMTLTLNYMGDDKRLLGGIGNSAGAPLSGLLPGAVLLLVLSILHRRETGPVPAGEETTSVLADEDGTEDGFQYSPESVPVPAVPAVPAPAPAVPEPVPAASPAVAAQGSTADSAEAGERTFEALLAEARTYRDELAAAGERISKDKLRLRLTVGSGKALELLRALKDEERGEAAEEAI